MNKGKNMAIVYINIERLLEDYHAEEIHVTFGNEEHDKTFREIRLNKKMIEEDGVLDCFTKEISETGEIKRITCISLPEGYSLNQLKKNYQKIGLMDDDGKWKKRNIG
jgi:hypothetical protein